MVLTEELDLFWWISVVELPALAGLFWLNWRLRRDWERQVAEDRQRFSQADERSRAALSAFKLEVAQSYASLSAMKDLEHRLTSHLLRIEKKLDQAALPPFDQRA
ncbi:hypothetical protein ACTL6U_21135 [Rhodovibrionaceae bacterium A322]